MDIKDRLRDIRNAHGISIKKLTDDTGIAYSTYTKYERGERELGVPVLIKLADYYGVTTDEILGRDPGRDDAAASVHGADDAINAQFANLPPEIRVAVLALLRMLTWKRGQGDTDDPDDIVANGTKNIDAKNPT